MIIQSSLTPLPTSLMSPGSPAAKRVRRVAMMVRARRSFNFDSQRRKVSVCLISNVMSVIVVYKLLSRKWLVGDPTKTHPISLGAPSLVMLSSSISMGCRCSLRQPLRRSGDRRQHRQTYSASPALPEANPYRQGEARRSLPHLPSSSQRAA